MEEVTMTRRNDITTVDDGKFYCEVMLVGCLCGGSVYNLV